MKRTAAMGRADLLRATLAAGSERSVAAGLLGYERRGLEAGQESESKAQYPSKTVPPVSPVEDSGAGSRVFRKIERGERLVRFLAPVEIEILNEEPRSTDAPTVDPLSDRELAMPAAAAEFADPLVPWSRLAPFLRRRLGTVFASRALDYRRLSRWVAGGRPWLGLPRRSRLSWGHSAWVLWDTSPEMEPYQPDVAEAVRRLKRERGRGGLRIVECYGPPSTLAGLPPQVPVLVFSAMGQLQADLATALGWAYLGRALAQAGHRTSALSPCPRRLQETGAVTVWPTAVWDRRQRLPRRLPLPRLADEPKTEVFGDRVPSEVAERLLDLVATATVVTPGLMRTIRLRLVPEADAGTEYEVWSHPDTTGSESLRYFSLRPGVALENRLRRFEALAQDPATSGLARQAKRIVDRHHEDVCSLAIALEAGVRGILAGAGEAKDFSRWLELLQRAVERLRDLADAPGNRVGAASGLAQWFCEWVELRLPPVMRAHPACAEWVARGVALARKFLACLEVPWPEGVDTEAAVRELRRHASRPGRIPARTYFLGLKGGDLFLAPEPLSARSFRFELGSIRAGDTMVHITEFVEQPGKSEPDRRLTSVPLGTLEPRGVRLLSMSEPAPILVESDRERVRLEALVRPAWAARLAYDRAGLVTELDLGTERHAVVWTLPVTPRSSGAAPPQEGSSVRGSWVPQSRPTWAERLWVDDFGVAAEFAVGGVAFVLRWIPPGKFLMGSPEDEPGRWEDEGPQHEVTLSRGFWLGETPVTQAQWRAVVEAAKDDPVVWLSARRTESLDRLNPEPSHFCGPPELPVEQVSFEDCASFCRLLNTLLLSGPGFLLPTEAQWEFACRAGTRSAVYTGGISIFGEHHAPELDPIAWYGGNSGLDLEVENPWDSSGWQNKQHSHVRAGTHRVKQKRPNALGLYDTLGNVWEWCRDTWYLYSKDAQTDPLHAVYSRGTYCVARGGSWDASARDCRAACRGFRGPSFRLGFLGFRLAAGQELGAAEPPLGGCGEPGGAEAQAK